MPTALKYYFVAKAAKAPPKTDVGNYQTNILSVVKKIKSIFPRLNT